MSTPVTTTDLSFLNHLQDVVASARAFAAQATQAVRLRTRASWAARKRARNSGLYGGLMAGL